MASKLQPIPERAMKEIGNTMNSYWKFFSLAQLGEFIMFALWFTLRSPFTWRGLTTWEFLNRFQWTDYITQGILVLGWSVFLYFLILLLWPLLKNLHIQSHNFSWLNIAWGFLLLGTLLQMLQHLFKLINYIQYYNFIRQVASTTNPNFNEMYGLLFGASSIMNISSYLNIIPASIFFIGLILAYTWGRTMAKHKSGKFSLGDCERGFLIAVAGAALLVLRTVFDLHPTFPVIWAWIFGVLAIILGLKKVAECLIIFSVK